MPRGGTCLPQISGFKLESCDEAQSRAQSALIKTDPAQKGSPGGLYRECRVGNVEMRLVIQQLKPSLTSINSETYKKS